MKWITRRNIRVSRTAPCWLIQRFLDPEAEFIFVSPEEVAAIQNETGGVGFDAPDARYPHQDAHGLCSFAALVHERLAGDPVLVEMGRLVQAADISGAARRSSGPRGGFNSSAGAFRWSPKMIKRWRAPLCLRCSLCEHQEQLGELMPLTIVEARLRQTPFAKGLTK